MNLKKKLRKFFALNRKSDGGFTLVELIVVIAILAILAGVAVPAYSGYVEKAERAADEALLNEINTAFVSACLNNGENNYFRTDDPTITLDNGVAARNALNTANDNVDASFEGFFEGGTFKVMTDLFYNKALGMFAENATMTFSYGDGTISFSSADIANLSASEFAEIGMESLMGKVDWAVMFANMMAGGDDADGVYSPAFDALINSDENYDSLVALLGGEDAFDALIIERATAMAIANGYSAEEAKTYYELYYSDAELELLSNNAVLVAATNYGYVADSFVNDLANGTAVDTLKSNISSDPESAIAQAGFAYAMYTAYQNANGQVVSEDLTLDEVYEVLGSSGFKSYMTTEAAQNDIAGYEAGMNMISDSCSDSEAVANLLLNGYSDPELIALLQQAMSQS